MYKFCKKSTNKWRLFQNLTGPGIYRWNRRGRDGAGAPATGPGPGPGTALEKSEPTRRSPSMWSRGQPHGPACCTRRTSAGIHWQLHAWRRLQALSTLRRGGRCRFPGMQSPGTWCIAKTQKMRVFETIYILITFYSQRLTQGGKKIRGAVALFWNVSKTEKMSF